MNAQLPTKRGRGYTLLEGLVVLAVLVVGLAILPVLISRPKGCCIRLTDAVQVRGITQALVVWASNNNGSYPLPSALDAADVTVPEQGESKNTTANILSVMIWNGNLSPEMCISPQEVNPQIRRYDEYQYEKPGGAQRPADALWDPSFKGTPDDPTTYANLPNVGVGHQSYAHLLPFGNRRKQWTDTYNVNEAVFGNRGPTYAASDAAPSAEKWSLLPGPLGTASNTLLIHGGAKTWEGNIGYNDNHVNFETSPTPDALSLVVPGKPGARVNALMPDNLFVNETDQLSGDGVSGRVDAGSNAYLRPISQVSDPARPRVWRD
jgi:type II secretory pathway pseudopilin PulG